MKCFELRKISDIELKNFRKTDGEKPMSDTDTNVFLSILQNFQERFFYCTLPVAISSSFKATGFTEAMMQTNLLLISALLALVGIFVFIFVKHKLSVVSRRLL